MAVEALLGATIGLIGVVSAVAMHMRAKREVAAALEQERATQRRFRDAFDEAAIGLALVAPDGRFLKVNKALGEIFGYTEDELLHTDFQTLTHPEDIAEDLRLVKSLLAGQHHYFREKRYIRKDGAVIWASLGVSLLRDERGAPLHFVSQIQDMTQRRACRENAQQTQLSEARFRSAFDAAAIGLALVSPQGKFIHVNRALVEFFGYTDDELHEKTFQQLTYHEDLDTDVALVNSLLEGKNDHYYREKRYVRKDGEVVWASLGVSLLRDESAQPMHFVSQIQDITDRKRHEAEMHEKDEYIRHLAFHDSLTDLPNRFLLNDRLQQEVVHAQSNGTRIAVLYLDLDRFKNVNDILGHKIGDDLLRDVGGRLRTCVRDIDTVARLGGDEFVVVLSQVRHLDEVTLAAERIVSTLITSFHHADQELNLTTSIGISVFPDDADSAESLVKNADTAMYRAKKQGRNNFQYFTTEMNERTLELLQLENSLRKALERQELRVYYQPKVDVKSGKITGMEALARWQHPELGLVPPVRFIPLAEEIGLIIPIGEWVLRMACQQNRIWHDSGFTDLRVAVNVSPRQFLLPNLAERVAEILKETSLDATFLELEVTESLLMHHADETTRTLEKLKEMGVRLSIDDFGTGYSNLSYLRQYAFDSLKIDQSFVRDVVSDNKQDSALAASILNLAQNLHKKAIAEGVETEAQFNFLLDHKCDEVQGYFLSKPLPPELFTELLQASQHVEGRMVSANP